MDPDRPRPVAADRAPGAERSLTPWLFLLGVTMLAFDLGSVLVKTPAVRPGVTAGDVLEVAGTFATIALYARVAAALGGAGGWFFAACAAYSLGHGVHVAANSLHDLLLRSGVRDPTGLAGFWDERVGHYLVDVARVLFAILLTRSEAAAGPGAAVPAARAPVLLGAAAYAFITFAFAVEGQTVPLVLPFAASYAAWSTATWRRGAARDPRASSRGPVRLFFTASSIASLALFAYWGIRQRGFPEFTATGILP